MNAVQDGRCPAREVLLAARFRSLSPMRHEKTKHQSLRQTQAGSLLVLDVAGEGSCPPYGRFWDGPSPTWFQDDRVTMQSSRLRSVLSPERSPATKGSTMRLRIVASAVAALALAVSAVGVIGASATQAGAAATGNCTAPAGPGVDWSGCNLNYRNLTGANLTGADLGGATLLYANLYRTDLTGATLTNATLFLADLNHAILIGANLTNAALAGAN